MEQNIQEGSMNQITFQDLIMRAYERGESDREITVGKLLEDIIGDLKNIISK
ncbi:hypothetical protein [Neobacillus sp. LXY-4]|uniref:hypothetical protein n=1 Tax=Neobacillus sp. LXY-4 TaxID=3379826 RepID=UPI003EE302E7